MSIQTMELVQEAEIFRESGEKPAKSAQQLSHKEIALEICNVWVKKKKKKPVVTGLEWVETVQDGERQSFQCPRTWTEWEWQVN